jgi:hypothetical protein
MLDFYDWLMQTLLRKLSGCDVANPDNLFHDVTQAITQALKNAGFGYADRAGAHA